MRTFLRVILFPGCSTGLDSRFQQGNSVEGCPGFLFFAVKARVLWFSSRYAVNNFPSGSAKFKHQGAPKNTQGSPHQPNRLPPPPVPSNRPPAPPTPTPPPPTAWGPFDQAPPPTFWALPGSGVLLAGAAVRRSRPVFRIVLGS